MSAIGGFAAYLIELIMARHELYRLSASNHKQARQEDERNFARPRDRPILQDLPIQVAINPR